MSTITSISRTHNIFFTRLTCKKVNELLKRADNKTLHSMTILEQDIQLRLPTNIEIKSYVRIDKESQCNIYLFIYKDKKQIGHITLHLTKENKLYGKIATRKNASHTNINGRLHVRNNRATTLNRHVIEVNNSKNIFQMYVRNVPHYAEFSLKNAANIALQVIGDYFNKESELFLGIQRTPPGNHKHFIKVIKNLSSSRTPLRSTRKVHQTVGDLCSISTDIAKN